MAVLQRSSETYRRSGSSGTVWEQKRRPASGELAARPARPMDARQQRSGGPSGHGGYRTGAGHVPPALDPPSPRVGVCGFCSLLGKDKRQPPRRRAGGKKGRRR